MCIVGGDKLKQTKQQRNARQRARRAENIAKWEQLGIDKKIISQFDLRNKNPNTTKSALKSEIISASNEIKNLRRIEKARQTRERNKAIRYEELKKHGFSPDEIKPKWTTSDNLMYEAMGRTNPKKVYHADEYLAIAFTPRQGATGIFNTSEYKKYTFDEIVEMIHERIDECYDNIDGSDVMTLIFQIEHGDKEHTEEVLQGFEQRGYNLKIGKLTDRRYFRLVNRNDWTMREYAEMVLCCISQCHNSDIAMIVSQLDYFQQDSGLPFDEIFRPNRNTIELIKEKLQGHKPKKKKKKK